MRKIYFSAFLLLFVLFNVNAQYQANGVASLSPSAGYPNEFQMIPPTSDHVSSSVINLTKLDLTKNFEINAQLFFGTDPAGGDGMAFLLQNASANYTANAGAGIGYHRFNGTYPSDIPADNPGPVPSFITEFDTYQNGFIGNADIADPAGDHIAFMSNSNAYHSSTDALQAPQLLGVNVKDGAWHDAKFSWNASAQVFTVSFLGNNYVYNGNLQSICSSSVVYWGFTASVGHALNEQRIRIVSVVNADPVSVSGIVTNTTTGGNINVSVTGGTAPYTYAWSNGATTEDLSNVPSGTYTVTVTDANNFTDQETFTVTAITTGPQISCAGTVTSCYNFLNYYSIPQLTVNGNGTGVTVSYVITGATNRSGNGKNASGIFYPGQSIIKWKALDAAGGVSLCTTTVNINKISVNIPDVVAVNPGGAVNTLYIGYGPSYLTLTTTATGGTAPYTYLWNTGQTGASIRVSGTSQGYKLLIVYVKDAKGCISFGYKIIYVDDIRCGSNKVQICHLNSANRRTALCVDKSTVAAHLAHGDNLGACNYNDDNTYRSVTNNNNLESDVTTPKSVFPNPSTGRFNVPLKDIEAGKAQLVIMNSFGQTLETRNIEVNYKNQNLVVDLSNRSSGIYFIKIINGSSVQTEKLILQK